MARLVLDFETRSMAPFGKDPKSVGLYQYARHPTTSVWCFAYRFDKEHVETWWRDQPLPERVVEHVRMGEPMSFVAHNAGFERQIWNYTLFRMMNGYLPGLSIEQMDCTLARCKALSLPPDLERAAKVVGAPYQKDMTGSEAMLKMAKPKLVTFNGAAADLHAKGAPIHILDDKLSYSTYRIGDNYNDVMRIDWLYDDALRGKMNGYCATDVLAECGVDDVVSPLSPSELELWRWNERVNDRGIPFDAKLIDAVQSAAAAGRASADRRMWTLTNGKVKKCSQHAALAEWLNARGVITDTVAKGATDELVAAADTLKDTDAAEAIRLHNATSKSSTSKMAKAKQMMSPDNHVRGVFSYHSAATGRFSAYGYQAHNLVRIDEEAELPTVRQIVGILDRFEPAVAYEAIDIIFGQAMHWLSKCARPTIKAPAGKIFRGADLSNIEGRANAWVAGEQWKLDAFLAYDQGVGADLYKVTAAGLLNIEPGAVSKLQRQAFGKVPELASGYQGSVGAYVTMGITTGVRPEVIASVAAETTDARVWALVAKGYRAKYSSGLEQSVWTGVKVVVNAWRQKHPMIVQGWWDRQDACIQAVSNPGQIVPVCDGRVRYLSSHGFLWSMLASGRMIAYPQPSIVRVPYMKERIEVIDGVEVIIEEEAYKNAVQVWGIDGTTKQWAPYTLYGGILCENDVQGISRDVFSDGGKRLTAAGYDVCFHCHDEHLTVCDPTFGSRQELETLLTVQPQYAPGLPLAAKAWEDTRYVK